MSAASRPDDDDTSPRADVLRAIRRVEKERAAGLFLILGLALAGAVREGLTFSSGPEVLLAAVLAALCFVYATLCALRIDGYKRELRDLPPRWTP